MQAPSITVKQKTIIIEVLILVAVFGGAYYLYTYFQESITTTSQVSSGNELLGKNFVNFTNATTKDKVSFKEITFLKKELVEMLQDYSEIISPNATRGRLDPFLPYASSRPLR